MPLRKSLGTLLANDLAVLMSERFEVSRSLDQTPAVQAFESQRSGERRFRRWGVALAIADVGLSALLSLWLVQREPRSDDQTTAGNTPMAEATSTDRSAAGHDPPRLELRWLGAGASNGVPRHLAVRRFRITR